MNENDECNDIDKRVTKVEMITASFSSDIKDIKDVLNKMAVSLQALAVWEERHTNMTDTLKRAFKAIEKIEDRVEGLEKTITPIKATTESIHKSIAEIEPYMPEIKRSSGWVYNAVVAFVGLEGLTLVGGFIYYLATK